jgi:uncharacterized membrane protein
MAAPYGMPPGGYVPRVRFEAIGEAWKILQPNFGVWAPSVLIAVVLLYAVMFGMMFALGAILGLQITAMGVQPNASAATGFAITAMLMPIIVGFAAGILSYVMLGGLYYMGVKAARGEPIEIGDVFAGFKLFPNLVGAYFLVQLLVIAGMILCVLPGLIMQGLMMLVVPIIMDQKVGPVRAIQMSFEVLKREWWMPILFFIVVSILSGLGAIACGIGIIFTLPLMFISMGIVYRDFFYGTPAPAYGAAAPPGYGPQPPAGAPPAGFEPQAPPAPNEPPTPPSG